MFILYANCLTSIKKIKQMYNKDKKKHTNLSKILSGIWKTLYDICNLLTINSDF